MILGPPVESLCEGGGLPKPVVADGTIVWRHDDAAGIAFSALPPDAATVVGDYLDAREGAPARDGPRADA